MQIQHLFNNRLSSPKTSDITDVLSQETEESKLYTKYGNTLTREQTAETLGISISTLDRLIKKGDKRLFPKYFKIGKQYRFLVEAVAEFKQNNSFYQGRA